MPMYKYLMWCETENNYVTTWASSPPTLCPNSSSHTIDQSRTTVVEEMGDQTVFIQGKSYNNTQGYYQMQGHTVNISASNTTIYDMVHKIPICVYGTSFTSGTQHNGDSIDIIINPDTPLGVITQSANIGDKTFTVSQTVIDNIKIGFDVKLHDNTNINLLGVVLSIDNAAMTITTEFPTTNTFNANTTAVVIDVHIVKNYNIGEPWHHSIGSGTLAGKYLPAGTKIRIVYTNNSDTEKVMNYATELNY